MKKTKGMALGILLAKVASSVGGAVDFPHLGSSTTKGESSNSRNKSEISPERKSTSSDVKNVFQKSPVSFTDKTMNTNNSPAAAVGRETVGSEFLNDDSALGGENSFSGKIQAGNDQFEKGHKSKIKAGRGFSNLAKRGNRSSLEMLKRKGLLGYLGSVSSTFLEENKKHLVGLAAFIAAPLVKIFCFFKNKIRRSGEFDKKPDVFGMAEDCSQWYLSDREHFADNIKCCEFYQLYSAYKIGFRGLLSITEDEEERYKNILYLELMSRLSDGGEIYRYLCEEIIGGEEVDLIARSVLTFLREMVSYDPTKPGSQVPLIFCVGIGGTGKSHLADIIYYIFTGCEITVVPINIAAKDSREASEQISGWGASYNNSEKLTQLLETAADISIPIVLFDELEKMFPTAQALGAFLTLITSKLITRNYNNQTYPIRFGIIITTNFESHQFLYAINELREAAVGNGDRRVAIEALKQAYRDNIRQWGNYAMFSRAVIVPVFIALRRCPGYMLIDGFLIDLANDRKKFSVIYSDKVSKDEVLKMRVLKKIYEELIKINKSVDIVGRTVKNNTRIVIENLCREKYPNVSLGPSHVVILDWDEQKNDIDIKLEFKQQNDLLAQ